MKVRGMIAALLLGLGVSVASANTINVVLDSGPTPVGSDYQWVYKADNTATSYVKPGDFFTIYDIAGLIGTPTFSSALWDVTVQTPGVTPSNVTPPDTALPNVTVTYKAGNPNIPGAVTLGYLTVVTDNNYIARGWFSSTDTTNGETTYHASRVDVPAVPLPAAAWAGMALFGAIGAARVRRSMKA